MRRTYQPNKRHAQKTHGFRARMQGWGKIVIKRRRAKGRRVLSR